MEESVTRNAIEELLRAIESRDIRMVAAALHPDASWQNVPHPPIVGREAVLEFLAGILCWSNRVQWDVLSAVIDGDTGWYERVDRFWLADQEYAVACNGIITVDTVAQTVLSIRDYVDLGEWRDRVSPAIKFFQSQPAAVVVERHLCAVEQREPVSMAADFGMHAVLERPEGRYNGWCEIADYFDSVPDCLKGRELMFDPIETEHGSSVSVSWKIRDRGKYSVTGVDYYEVVSGRIMRQKTTFRGVGV